MVFSRLGAVLSLLSSVFSSGSAFATLQDWQISHNNIDFKKIIVDNITGGKIEYNTANKEYRFDRILQLAGNVVQLGTVDISNAEPNAKYEIIYNPSISSDYNVEKIIITNERGETKEHNQFTLNSEGRQKLYVGVNLSLEKTVLQKEGSLSVPLNLSIIYPVP